MQSICKAKARLSLPRTAVSAEAYGIFNKKENFKPRKIQKTQEQIDRIKARILQSFLFHNLDSPDLDIVIEAMEERKFWYISIDIFSFKKKTNYKKFFYIFILLRRR